MNSNRFEILLMLGVTGGITLASGGWPGGYDGLHYYLRAWWPGTTAPAWVYLVTQPLAVLPWPEAWQALTLLTVVLVLWACRVWGNRCWPLALFSAPLLNAIWLGQVEALPVAGAALAWAVSEQHTPPAWAGLAWLLLLTKPQVGIGLVLLSAWSLWREQGTKPFVDALLLTGGIVLLTVLIWGWWPPLWLASIAAHDLTGMTWNGAIWPLGLLFVPLALWPEEVGKARRWRMVAAATLIAAPYITQYHALALLTMTGQPLLLALAWLPQLLSVAYGVRFDVLWPLAVLIFDLAYLAHRRELHRQMLEQLPPDQAVSRFSRSSRRRTGPGRATGGPQSV